METNPNNAVCPDYNQPIYLRARQSLMTDDISEARAVEILVKAWQANNEVDRLLWQQRIDAEAVRTVKKARESSREENDALARAEAEQDRLEALREDRKRYRSKYIAIPDRPPPTHPAFVPVPYARQKIKQGHYLEMCYFTNRGHALAKTSTVNMDDEALIICRDAVSGELKWVPANTRRDPATIIPDHELTTEDLDVAIPRFLKAVTAANWPAQRVDMLRRFWSQLLSHEYRSSSDAVDVQTIITYQAEQRAAWHEAITGSMNAEGAWDIGIISKDIMRNTREKVYCQHREMARRAELDPIIAKSGTNSDQQSSRTHSRRHSRSASPPRRNQARHSPTRQHGDRESRYKEDFRGRAGRSDVCLGRDPHAVVLGSATRTWKDAYSVLAKRKDPRPYMFTGQQFLQLAGGKRDALKQPTSSR